MCNIRKVNTPFLVSFPFFSVTIIDHMKKEAIIVCHILNSMKCIKILITRVFSPVGL